jgi:hypothetical protein
VRATPRVKPCHTERAANPAIRQLMTHTTQFIGFRRNCDGQTSSSVLHVLLPIRCESSPISAAPVFAKSRTGRLVGLRRYCGSKLRETRRCSVLLFGEFKVFNRWRFPSQKRSRHDHGLSVRTVSRFHGREISSLYPLVGRCSGEDRRDPAVTAQVAR